MKGSGNFHLDKALEFYRKSGAYSVVELYIRQRGDDIWLGYVWLFDGTRGKKDLEVTGVSILDVLCKMEEIVSETELCL